MKLKENYIVKYLTSFRYELSREQLEQEWEFDTVPYYREKDCWCFHAEDGSWLEVPNLDLVKAFNGPLDLPLAVLFTYRQGIKDGTITNDVQFLSKYRNKSLEEIGKEDYKESSFCAGVEHEKKVAIEACQKVIDMFYDSKFDPTIDYMKIFKENL